MSKNARDFEQLRYVRLGSFTVRTYDLWYNDRHGKPAIGYRIAQSQWFGERKRVVVVAECYDHAGAVYCGHGTPIDSDACLASVIGLVCHAAQHDSDDHPITPTWDAEGLAEEASMRWGDL